MLEKVLQILQHWLVEYKVFNSSFFIQARDKVYFNVNIDYNFDTKDLEMIKLYYNIDGNDRTIIEANHFMNLEFTDFYGYQEYVDFQYTN